MRTTIDLPDVADLVRRAPTQTGAADVSRSARTRLPVVRLGTVITTDDVRALDDDQ
jgi:hypothetical protein